MTQEIRVTVTPAAQGRANKINFIGPEFDATLVLGYQNLKPGVLFDVVAENYLLGVEIRNQDAILLRNGTLISVPLAAPANRGPHFILNFAWSPTELRLYIIDREGERGYTATTTPVFPPNALKEWARREALMPTVTYDSGQHLLEVIMDQLYKLRESLKDTNGINGFWNIEYEGQKIISRKPKREPDIHPTIRLLLYDLEIIKNFQIVPEFPTGNGRLDFLITAPLKDGTTGKVCVEIKNAHSADLANGLLEQLPAYMDTTKTDYGVYAVLDYNAPYKFPMSAFQFKNYPGKIDTLEMALNIGTSQTNRRFLRNIILPVGPSTPPSKKEHKA